MKGDFTRDTFRPERRYSSVRMQQGRVQLDADWNEAEDIRLARERIEVRDIVGPCGAPIDNAGFEVTFKDKDFLFGMGRLYVHGVLAQNDGQVAFLGQSDYPIGKLPDPIKPDGSGTPPSGIGTAYLFYLDVWEEHITALEDNLLREVALNGPDTATRLRVVWQVKAIALPAAVRTCAAAMGLLAGPTDARLVAKAKSLDDTEACTVKPGSSYKRLENQLYRVEVHEGGALKDATFKWSRDNGSVVSGFTIVDARTLTMDQIGRDAVLSFQAGGWIEVTDRKRELLAQPGVFFRVAKVEGNRLLLDPAKPGIVAADFGAGMKARRWDSQGAIHYDGLNPEGFLLLEDGVEIALTGTDFRSGDYWLIPARTVTGDVEWPFAAPQPPRGIVHHRCPLAIATAVSPTAGADKSGWDIVDCRNPFVPLADVIGMFYGGGDGQTAVHNDAGALVLAQAPTVGVARGKRPVKGAKVRWTVVKGGGSISGPAIKETGIDGLISCPWNLGNVEEVQQLRAELLDSEGNPTHIPIVFTAFLPKPTGGAAGCCRSIGQDGDYPTIEAAIKDLVFKQKMTGICLCLMAGTHEWPSKIDEQPPESLANITITGIGDASILTANDGFQIEHVPNLTLLFSDLAFKATSILIHGVTEAGFQSVTMTLNAKDGTDGPQGFSVTSTPKVCIHHCEIHSDAPLTFDDDAQLSITETTAVVVANGHAISVGRSGRLTVERCFFNGLVRGGVGATLAVAQTLETRISGNDIAARRTFVGTDPTRGTVVGAVPVDRTSPLGTFVAKLADTMSAAVMKTEVKKLIGDRVASAGNLATLVASQGLTLGRAGAAGMQNLATTLADPKATEVKVTDAVAALNTAVANPRVDTGALATSEALGVALQIEDGSGIYHVVDNILRGIVALYGDPGSTRLDPNRMKAYQGLIRQNPGTWGAGSLYFSKNFVVAINLAAYFATDAATQDLVKGNFTVPVFGKAAIGENTISFTPVEILFGAGAVTSNAIPGVDGLAGIVIARQATFTGNIAPGGVSLVSATAGQAVAGNLGISFN